MKEKRYLLLHSSLSSARQWQPLMALLDPEKCVALDLLGYGQAMTQAWPRRAVTLDEEQAALLKQLPSNWQDFSWHLIGHSYGGVNALKLAHDFPEAIASLSLYEPVAFFLLVGEERETALALMAEISASLDAGQPEKAAERFIDYWNQPGSFAALPERQQQAFTLGIHKVAADFHALMSASLNLDQLRQRITQPTLLMQGSFSQPTAHQVIQQLAASLSLSQVVEFQAGHMGAISHSHEVNERIIHFLSEQPKITSH
ncbi:Pimeloyl-ACP methyl ester carboxylesterase [Marinospirillum celere]|uniref:Pimeloyl-ACP methyl ester carboxylesterase n=1 Tax=Marinospirillum celere TaxID=1122252 RepID=A0A1I1H5U7_9GAMM|nr:alpha/beta hydrolase [Marinospirillum celere]SFC16540.1 Pimeloyl-ACP methyl ester carboxylesterase [Marinospirillum celere]